LSEAAPFDRRTVRAHRARASATHDFLIREIADRLADRLDDVTRKFTVALDLGCHAGELAAKLGRRAPTLVQADACEALVRRASGLRVVADEEVQPFAEGAFDLVVSSLSLHWTNDLPGALVQARRALKPDGLFLAAMLGGETLRELRQCLIEAEAMVAGGASPRVSPMVDLRDAAGLLQRAGFALPVADLDELTLTYADPFALMRELRGLGETNALRLRTKGFTRRAVLLEAARLYVERFGLDDGRIPATFQVVWLVGWAPHESQPKPLPRGSGKTPLGEALR
jgi:SAM-dependent methyltransferase